jgi:hypothetical protein
MPSDFFRRQLASYASVPPLGAQQGDAFRRHPAHRRLAAVGLALWRVQLGGREVSMAMVVAVLAVLGWMALDLGIGLIMAALMVPAWYGAEAFAGRSGPLPP